MGNAASLGSAPRTAVAPYGQQNNQPINYQAQTACTQQCQPEPFWQAAFHDPVAAFTLWLAVATTGLWGFTGALWWVTYRLSKEAKASSDRQAKNAEAGLRAYLDFDGVQFMPPKHGDIPEGVRVVTKNYGQTPAYEVRQTIELFLKRVDAAEIWPVEGSITEGRAGTITLNDDHKWNVTFPIPMEMWATLKAGMTRLIVQMRVTYLDAFEQPHILESDFESTGGQGLFHYIAGSRKAD